MNFFDMLCKEKEEQYRVFFSGIKSSRDGIGYAYFDSKEEAYAYAEQYGLTVLLIRRA